MTKLISHRNSTLKPGEMRCQDAMGMSQFEIRSQEETAAIMGVTRQYVQQIERSAMIKIRRALMLEYQEVVG